jgi:MATE family multidrug resistance protein
MAPTPLTSVDQDTPFRSWWNRRCGPREVFALALPLVMTTASWAIMHFVDRVFLTWYSADAVAAAMPSGMLLWAMISCPVGVALYLNTFVAQYHGARRPERIGAVTWQALRIGLYSTPLFIGLIPVAAWVFRRV